MAGFGGGFEGGRGEPGDWGDEFDENGNYKRKEVEKSSENNEKLTNDELEKTAELIEELDDLLYKIVETGPALDPQILAAMRARVASIFKILGVKDAFDPKFINLRIAIDKPTEYVKLKIDYPDFGTFKRNYEAMKLESKKLRKFDCTVDPGLDTFITYSRLDTDKLRLEDEEKRIQYLYDLGKSLCNSLSYRDIEKDGELTVRADWSIATGRHRTAALKALGIEFCYGNDMQKWIKPILENNSVFRDDMGQRPL
jgi:hypothetical protein